MYKGEIAELGLFGAKNSVSVSNSLMIPYQIVTHFEVILPYVLNINTI